MDPAQSLHWLERYQTLVVGGFGFLGVIITLFVNAWLARRERRHDLAKERRTLRVALREELKINKQSFETNTKRLEEKDQEGAGDLVIPRGTMDDVYTAFVPKIGLLSSRETEKVMLAYLTLREFHRSVRLLSGDEVTEDHVIVPEAMRPSITKMMRSIIPKIDDAITSLSKQC